MGQSTTAGYISKLCIFCDASKTSSRIQEEGKRVKRGGEDDKWGEAAYAPHNVALRVAEVVEELAITLGPAGAALQRKRISDADDAPTDKNANKGAPEVLFLESNAAMQRGAGRQG